MTLRAFGVGLEKMQPGQMVVRPRIVGVDRQCPFECRHRIVNAPLSIGEQTSYV